MISYSRLFIKRQASDILSDNEWQWVVQRLTTSGTTIDNEWYNKSHRKRPKKTVILGFKTKQKDYLIPGGFCLFWHARVSERHKHQEMKWWEISRPFQTYINRRVLFYHFLRKFNRRNRKLQWKFNWELLLYLMENLGHGLFLVSLRQRFSSRPSCTTREFITKQQKYFRSFCKKLDDFYAPICIDSVPFCNNMGCFDL